MVTGGSGRVRGGGSQAAYRRRPLLSERRIRRSCRAPRLGDSTRAADANGPRSPGGRPEDGQRPRSGLRERRCGRAGAPGGSRRAGRSSYATLVAKGNHGRGPESKRTSSAFPWQGSSSPTSSASKLVRPLQDQRHELCSPHPDAFLTVTCDSAKTEL